jgi:hypothetical protein
MTTRHEAIPAPAGDHLESKDTDSTAENVALLKLQSQISINHRILLRAKIARDDVFNRQMVAVRY